MISRRDALIDGLNMMVSPQYTLKRRYGFSDACSVPFGSNEWPLTFASFQQLNGTVTSIVDTQTNVYEFGSAFKTSIYTKLANAKESSFVSDLTWLYWVDGVSANKFNGTTVYNLSIAPPATAPAIQTVETGASAIQWVASTWFSTMGIMVDANGNAQQLIATTTGTQFGLSSTGQPPWNNTPGSTTSETGGVTWINEGLLGYWNTVNTGHLYKYWQDDTHFDQPGAIWTPQGVLYVQNFNKGTGINVTTGSSYPPFSGAPFQSLPDGFCTWIDGAAGVTPPWAPSSSYVVGQLIFQPSAPPSTPQTPVYLMKCTHAGTSDASFSSASFSQGAPTSTTAGATTLDNQLQWICLGSATWQAVHSYLPWISSGKQNFNCIKDSLGGAGGPGNLQVCIGALVNGSLVLGATGTSGLTAPSWPVTLGANSYGAQTVDGTVVWACLGADTGWLSNTSYYLPASGFNAPVGGATTFGGALIVESSTIQFVSNTGVSQTPGPPTWNATVKGQTSDGTVTWTNGGPVLANGIPPWFTGYAYAYSYKARSATDYYSVPILLGTPPVLQLPIPPGDATAPNNFGTLPPPTGSQSGGISTASPVTLILGSNAGAENILTLVGSTDPQVDTIVIWRSKDGGGSSNMFELTEIPNPTVVNGSAGIVTYVDFQPDAVLNTQILAPIANANNPIPTGADILVWHAGRLWAAVGNVLYFSGGPDTNPGVGQEAWPPGNNFSLPGNITALTSTTSGLIISVNDDAYVLTGTTASTFTAPIIWQANFGTPTMNAVAQDGDNVFFFTTKGQIWHFSANGLAEIGYLNAVDFAAMTPSSVYIAVHRSGVDEGVFVSDGSANLWRYSQNSSSWDPVYQPVNGVGAIGSIETSNGTWQLLTGLPVGSGYIRARNLNVWTDFASLTPVAPAFIVQQVVTQALFDPAVCTFANPNTAGNLLLAFVRTDDSTANVQISDTAGNTWTKLYENDSQSSVGGFIVWYCVAKSYSSADVVTIHCPGFTTVHTDAYLLEVANAVLPLATSANQGSGTAVACGPLNGLSFSAVLAGSSVLWDSVIVYLGNGGYLAFAGVPNGSSSFPVSAFSTQWRSAMTGAWSQLFSSLPVLISNAGGVGGVGANNTLALNAPVAVGDFIYYAWMDNETSTPTTTKPSDNLGNAYTNNHVYTDNANYVAAFGSCVVSVAGTATVNISFPSNITGSLALAVVKNAGAVDVEGTAGPTTTTSLTATLSSPTTVMDHLISASFGLGSALTNGDGVYIAQHTAAHAGTQYSTGISYRLENLLGTYSTTWTHGSSIPIGADLLAVKDTAFTQLPYSANATVGSLVVAPPRQVANIASVLVQAVVIGTYPTVSVMLNEIKDISSFPATFTVLPNPVVDPPELVGYQNTIYMKRHDLKAASVPLPQHVQHMQVKIDFGMDTVANELLGLGLA